MFYGYFFKDCKHCCNGIFGAIFSELDYLFFQFRYEGIIKNATAY
jgi:hypothetical protein